jgi:hypothetical protein
MSKSRKGPPKIYLDNDFNEKEINIGFKYGGFSLNYNLPYESIARGINKFTKSVEEEAIMMTSGNNPYSLGHAEPVRESTKAVLFNVEGEEMRVPKSAIHDESEVWEDGQPPGELVVLLWWAERRGLA